MIQARLGHTVQVHCTSRLDDGTILDASAPGAPLEFTLGAGTIKPGIEQAVVGMRVGDNKTLLIPSEQAYGRHQPKRVITVPRRQISKTLQPEVEQRLELHPLDGPIIEMTIVAVTDLHVTLDTNHPLAGKDLTLDLMLVAIVEIPPDEPMWV